MPSAFPFDASPFDCLSSGERALVRNSVDIVYFPADTRILDLGDVPTHLHVIIKGYVQQCEGEEVITVCGPQDCFDARGLMAGKVSSRFVAAEEVIAYLLPGDVVGSLISANATFGALLFSDLSNKLNVLAQRQSHHELYSLTLARIDDTFIRPPHYVDGTTDIVTVVQDFNARRADNVLVRDHRDGSERIGIFTNTDLQRAIIDGRPLNQLPVAELANFRLVKIEASAHLFDALLLMVRHDIHRLVVVEGEQIVGLLEQLDLLSFLSNHSYLITLQISSARSIDQLTRAALQIHRLIAVLHSGGTRVEHISRLVAEVNAKLFERTWQLIAPPDLVEASCLIVMGSEGRGEQLLRTDQDNGLILRDGQGTRRDLPDVCDRFSEALRGFGYPDCPGGIMLSRPQWRAEVGEFSRRVQDWIWKPDGQSLLALAIFMDARAVCGDTTLLDRVRGCAVDALTGDGGLIARFASPVVVFGEQGHWWSRLLGRGSEEQLDLKKAGTFPIVHGIRTLALEARIAETGTLPRIDRLLAKGVIPPDLAADLRESLHVLMGLKLKAGLEDLAFGRAPGNAIELAALTTLERDLLKDTLAIVKRFRLWLVHHYRLDALA
jgi:CBS domain-containing protein